MYVCVCAFSFSHLYYFLNFLFKFYHIFQTVISNVLSNAKEILKMLVTMTGYMTNTISMCQELVASNTAVRLSSASAGSKYGDIGCTVVSFTAAPLNF